MTGFDILILLMTHRCTDEWTVRWKELSIVDTAPTYNVLHGKKYEQLKTLSRRL